VAAAAVKAVGVFCYCVLAIWVLLLLLLLLLLVKRCIIILMGMVARRLMLMGLLVPWLALMFIIFMLMVPVVTVVNCFLTGCAAVGSWHNNSRRSSACQASLQLLTDSSNRCIGVSFAEAVSCCCFCCCCGAEADIIQQYLQQDSRTAGDSAVSLHTTIYVLLKTALQNVLIDTALQHVAKSQQQKQRVTAYQGNNSGSLHTPG
jgi:hypothetical protein